MDRPITQVLRAAAEGSAEASAEAFAAVYGELRRIAKSNRRRWHGNPTMNTTALVHEAYIRLAGSADWQSRVHFYATAARAMRQILIHYAERQNAAKRGGGLAPLPIDDFEIPDPTAVDDLIALEQALTELERGDERQCRVVECRFFAGMGIDETAAALGISAATVKRDWLLASARLGRMLNPDPRDGQ